MKRSENGEQEHMHNHRGISPALAVPGLLALLVTIIELAKSTS